MELVDLLIYNYTVVFIFGAMIGSFLNVCIHRLPREQSIVTPPSNCPKCKNHIRCYDNIPILSYILLGGKCRFCKASISVRYPFIEFLTGFFATLLFFRFGLTADLFIYFIFLASLIVITFIDLDERIIPNEISIPGIGVGLLSSLFLSDLTFRDSFIGAIVGGGILITVAFAYHLVTKREGMGGGDIKLLAMIGAFLGWKGALVTLFLGSFVGAFTGIFFMIREGKDTKYAVPFGPFLAIGAFIYLFFGNDIVRWYISFNKW
ncbi:MAG: prepilin peptidase [Thermodesulfobacteriota bacterium]